MTRTTGALLRIAAAAAAIGWAGAAEVSAQTAGAAQTAGDPLNSLAVTGQIVDAEGSTVRVHADGAWLAIDMSEWSWAERKDPDQPFPEVGEEITAYAPLRASLFDEKVVRPNELYVHGRRAYFRLAPDGASWEVQAVPRLNPYAITPDTVALSGTVREVGGGRFSITSGGIDIVVDAGEMLKNPLDAVGSSLAPGDVVQVRGPLSILFLEERVLTASKITRIVALGGAGEG